MLGGIAKRSLTMVLQVCERAIVKAKGLGDATRSLGLNLKLSEHS
jgi:hypothetical protein